MKTIKLRFKEITISSDKLNYELYIKIWYGWKQYLDNSTQLSRSTFSSRDEAILSYLHSKQLSKKFVTFIEYPTILQY
jgi:hypothetical protein